MKQTKTNEQERRFRIMLREKLVDTGFCQVTEWRNFSDNIWLLIEKGKQEALKQVQEIIKKLTIEHNVLPVSDELIRVNNFEYPCWRQNIIQPEELNQELQKIK
jgi:hypothetical protein